LIILREEQRRCDIVKQNADTGNLLLQPARCRDLTFTPTNGPSSDPKTVTIVPGATACSRSVAP